VEAAWASGLPQHGTVINDGNSVTYTSNPGYIGQDGLTITIMAKTEGDSEAGFATMVVAIDVIP
jgi:hypothetical protein